MRSSRSSVRPSPCSIVFTPALSAASIPSHPIACAATFFPNRCASPTSILSSSSLKLTHERSRPSDVVLPVGVELYPVCPVLHLFADCFSDIFRTVDDLYSLGHLQFPRITKQRIRSRRRHR